FFFQAEDGIRDLIVTGVQTCALPIFGDVQTVTLTSESPSCGPRSVCHVRVNLRIRPSRRVHLMTWTVYSIDSCTGHLTPLGTAEIGRASCREGGWSAGVGG